MGIVRATMTRLLPVLCVVVASSAFAIAKGGTLYIACKDFKLLKEPKAAAKTVSPTPLALGDEVIWLGASDKDKSFHQVEHNGKKGFVHMSCLKPNKPMTELTGDQKPISPPAFASSGAATKGYPPTTRYAGAGQDEQQAAADLLKLEELNKNIDAAAIAAKEKELHSGK